MYEDFGPPGKIIEGLGLKGRCAGGVCISEKHANFFINQNKGSSHDFIELLELVKYKAKVTYGLDIIEEVQIVEPNAG
jgi:UDP-N-acetylmuramate dehydrogenase